MPQVKSTTAGGTPTRLDVALVERGLAPSRSRAQAAIAGGNVLVDGLAAVKPSMPVTPGNDIQLVGEQLPYVSRGGLKLERALQVFPIQLDGVLAMDCGASTGGFTDCMLQNGARRVVAVDVGHGQLDPKLAADPRVVNMEGTNARDLVPGQFGELFGFVSVDVSFISLALVLPVLRPLMACGAQAVCLIKPQFEAGRTKVGKRGVVRDQATHREVVARVCQQAVAAGFAVRGLTFSPIRGPEGNIEYLGWFQAADEQAVPEDQICGLQAIAQLVALAHGTLEQK